MTRVRAAVAMSKPFWLRLRASAVTSIRCSRRPVSAKGPTPIAETGPSAFVDPAQGGLVCRACGGARLLLREGRRGRFLASTLGDDVALRDDDAAPAIELIEATLAAHTQ